jgi:hypothetical protein
VGRLPSGAVKGFLADRRVNALSAGVDEVPQANNELRDVLVAQADR